jgi:hypothetical protein
MTLGSHEHRHVGGYRVHCFQNPKWYHEKDINPPLNALVAAHDITENVVSPLEH